MSIMRDRLKQSSPKLYEAFEKSWGIAWDFWFPVIGPQKDSFNSYPHIRNLENFLDKLVIAYENKTGKINGLFSDLETYVILSCILLHDIGRAVKSSYHWEESKELIETHWALLGIPSYEMALTIGKICKVHDYRPDESGFNLDSLTTVVIDPFGRVRERELGAILILCDHLDGSINRVVADFLKKDKDSIGAFRSKIRGVDIDLNGGLIKVVLGEDWGGGDAEPKDDERDDEERVKKYKKIIVDDIQFSLNDKLFELKPGVALNSNSLEYYLKHPLPIGIDGLLKEFDLEKSKNDFILTKANVKSFLNKNYKTNSKKKPHSIFESIWTKEPEIKTKVLDQLIAHQIIFANKREDESNKVESFIQKCNGSGFDFIQQNAITEKSLTLAPKLHFLTKLFAGRWSAIHPDPSAPAIPLRLILATVLGNTHENVEALQSITEILQSMNLPILGWCVEYKGHLYNWKGEETFEPIFSKSFLENTLQAMWCLSTRIFGANKLSYESLASEMREPNLVKVKRAVRRLNVFSTNCEKYISKSGESNAFWIAEDYWRWKVTPPPTKKTECIYLEKPEIDGYVEKLNSPSGGNE